MADLDREMDGLNELKARFFNLRDKHAAEMAVVREECEKLEREARSLRTLRDTDRAEIEHLKKRLSESEARVADEVARLSIRNEALEREAAKARSSESEAAQKRCRELEEELAALRLSSAARVDELTAEIARLSSGSQQMHDDVSELRVDAERLLQARDATIAELHQANTELDELNARLMRQVNEYRAQASESAVHQRQLEQRNEKIDSLMTELRQRETALAKLRTVNAELKSRSPAARSTSKNNPFDRIADLRAELKTTRDKLNAVESQRARFSDDALRMRALLVRMSRQSGIPVEPAALELSATPAPPVASHGAASVVSPAPGARVGAAIDDILAAGFSSPVSITAAAPAASAPAPSSPALGDSPPTASAGAASAGAGAAESAARSERLQSSSARIQEVMSELADFKRLLSNVTDA